MLKLTKHLYASTKSSLAKSDMLKIDVFPGEYKLIPFEEGYVFTKTTQDLKELDIIKIFNDRDGDKGLSGTYYGGESNDPNQLRLFRTWLYKHYDHSRDYQEPFVYYDIDELDDEDDYTERIETRKRELFKYDEYEARSFNFEAYNNYDFHAAERLDREERQKTDPKYIKSFGCYHNLPFLFYLNKEVSNFDDIHLEETDQNENCGYLWKVDEGEEHIGYVVQNKLHNMMGDQAGIAIYEGAVAFGNFDVDFYYRTGRDTIYLDKARFGYQCCFDKCECDTQYEYIIKRNEMRKLRLAEYKKKQEKEVVG